MSYFQDLRVFLSQTPLKPKGVTGILSLCLVNQRSRRVTPLGFRLRVIVNEKIIMEMQTFSFLNQWPRYVYLWGWGLSLYKKWVRYNKCVSTRSGYGTRSVFSTRSGYGARSVFGIRSGYGARSMFGTRSGYGTRSKCTVQFQMS